MDEGFNAMDADGIQPMYDDAAADPKHGDGADSAQNLQYDGHARDQPLAELPAESRVTVAHERDAHIVELHDDADHAINGEGDQYADCGEDGRLRINARRAGPPASAP